MTNQKEIRVATFNVRGLSTATEEVQKFRTNNSIHLLAITETWMKSNKTFPLGWRAEGLSPTQPRQGRGIGGVAIVMLGTPKYTVVYKYNSRDIQVFAIRIGDLTSQHCTSPHVHCHN